MRHIVERRVSWIDPTKEVYVYYSEFGEGKVKMTPAIRRDMNNVYRHWMDEQVKLAEANIAFYKRHWHHDRCSG